jgi:hypothetical protein
LNAPPVAPREQDAEDGIPLLDQTGQSLESVLDLEESSGDEKSSRKQGKNAEANDQFLFIDENHSSSESPQKPRDKRENSV